MNTLGRTLFYVDAVLALLFGLRYVTATVVHPYHLAFLGVPEGELAPAVRALLLLQYKAFGFQFLALAGGTAILATPAAAGNRWAWWALLVLGMLSVLPLAVITFFIGHGAPWWAPAVAVVLLAAALALTRRCEPR